MAWFATRAGVGVRELGLESPLRIGDATVIPVYWQRVSAGSWDGDTACVWGERSAAAVVVKRNAQVRAFAVDGREWHVDSLAAAVPELAALLASLRE